MSKAEDLRDKGNGGHPSARSEPINDTRLRRFLVLTAVKLLKHLRPQLSAVLFISDRICIKYGSYVDLSEASTLQFIARKTSIPVPKVYCAFTYHGQTYIVMERMRGDKLAKGWVDRTPESQAKILCQLKGMIQQMRHIQAPGPGVANVDGGSLYDGRLPGGSERFGPFKNIQEFHKRLREGVEAHPNHKPDISELIAWHEGPWSSPVFTHGDLSSLNILVRGDDVVGIIDWEISGWYPPYWEYATAAQVNPRNFFWRDEIDKFLDSTPKERAMEQIRLRWFGDF